MTASTQSICISIDPELQLPNTAPSKPVRLKGNYVAFPEKDSDPRAYKLHKADDTWKAEDQSVATVFIVVDEQGQARIS